MHVAHYLELQHRAAARLGDALRDVAEGHPDEPDLARICVRLAGECDGQAAAVEPFAQRYSLDAAQRPDQLHSDLFRGVRGGALGLLRDLHDLYLMAAECDLVWTVLRQAAYGARDEALLDVVTRAQQQTDGMLRWLRTRIRQAAPQALVVAT